jgi:serine/threonine-protein kinase
MQVFFSHDGQRIGFITAGRSLRIVSLTGEPPVTLADTGIVRGGGSWGTDGNIYVAAGTVAGGTELYGLGRFPVAGGPMTVVSTLDTTRAEVAHLMPDALPGGRGVLFTSQRGQLYQSELMEIAVLDLATGTHEVLLEGIMARFSESGHIIVIRADGSVVAAPFDEKALELTGPATPLFEGVAVDVRGWTNFDLSETGTLVYEPGETIYLGSDEVMRVARNGATEGIAPDWTGVFTDPRLSPDGTRLALAIGSDDGFPQIWIKQLDDGPLSKLTFDGTNARPTWTQDGATVLFPSLREGRATAFERRADGSVASQALPEAIGNVNEIVASSDGEWLVYRAGDAFYAQRRGVGNDPMPLNLSASTNRSLALSPDGRWLAYTSDESGRMEVYVRPFPNTDQGKWLISTGGGTEPVWARDGSELFYRRTEGADRSLVAVQILAGETIVIGGQQDLFPTVPFRFNLSHRQYDVSADGESFIFVGQLRNEESVHPVIVVENFVEELRERVPN